MKWTFWKNLRMWQKNASQLSPIPSSESNGVEIENSPKHNFSRGVWLGIIFSLSFLLGILSNNIGKTEIKTPTNFTNSPTLTKESSNENRSYFSKKVGIKFDIPPGYRLSEEIFDPSSDPNKKHVIIILSRGTDTIFVEKNAIEKTPAKEIEEKNLIIAGFEAKHLTRLFTYEGAVVNPNTYGALTFEDAGSVQSFLDMKIGENQWSIFGAVLSASMKDQFLTHQEELLKMVQSFEFLD